jgi:hypothetical protein
MLRNWLNCKLHTHPYQKANGYGLTIVKERNPHNPARVKQQLRRWLRYCYCSSDYVQRRITSRAYPNAEDLYQQEKFPKQWKNKAADFGEVVGHYLLESHPSFGFWLPVLRLREKPDPEGSPRGFDLLGFSLEEDAGFNLLCIGEVRLRSTTNATTQTIVKGHRTLRKYDRRREIRAIGRTAHWLFNQGKNDDMDKLARFSDPWAPSFERRHIFIGVLDDNISINRMIKVMNKTADILPTFTACLTIVANLRNKVEEAFEP